jgi:nitrogen fixation protein FixH
MKKISKLSATAIVFAFIAIAITIAVTAAVSGCGTPPSRESETPDVIPSIADGDNYSLKYEWPEKPKVGNYTLKVNLTDGSGNQVEDADVVVSYDMPSMRGHHAATETMKKNSNGDFLLPIHFAMPGDWEIVLSAVKDDVEIAAELILLDI